MKIAVVTVVYPAALRYLSDFFQSLKNQHDQYFSLWVALDRVSQKNVLDYTYKNFEIHIFKFPENINPTSIRNLISREAVSNSDAVVFADSDDILLNTRISFAKCYANKYDVTATAMQYINSDAVSLSGQFSPKNADLNLIRSNCYGLSNSTWNSNTLKKVLPAPEGCILMDWYMATLALYSGASLGYDTAPRMLYRQHPGNIAVSRPPFRAEQITKATDLVLGHYDLVLTAFAERGLAGSEKFELERERVKRFRQAIHKQPILEKYVTALNALPDRHVWWSCVAHPDLERIWAR